MLEKPKADDGGFSHMTIQIVKARDIVNYPSPKGNGLLRA